MIISSNHRPAPGSTLIGALIPILILSIGMAALSRLYINDPLTSPYSHHLSTALAFARDKIEVLRYENNVVNVTGSEQLQNQGLLYLRNWAISNNNGPDYRSINVTLQWQDSSGEHSIALHTVISGQPSGALPFSGQP